MDLELVAECVKSIEAIVGRDVFPNDAMDDAIRACNYNVETAIDHLYGMCRIEILHILECA